MGVISAFSCYRRSIMPMVSLVALVGGEEGEEHEEVEQRGRAEAGDQHLRARGRLDRRCRRRVRTLARVASRRCPPLSVTTIPGPPAG